jgi:hypothetical protein
MEYAAAKKHKTAAITRQTEPGGRRNPVPCRGTLIAMSGARSLNNKENARIAIAAMEKSSAGRVIFGTLVVLPRTDY